MYIDRLILFCSRNLFKTYILQRNYGNYFYNKGQNLRPVFTKAYDDVLEKYDVLFMPTMPCTAPEFPLPDAPIKGESVKVLGIWISCLLLVLEIHRYKKA